VRRGVALAIALSQRGWPRGLSGGIIAVAVVSSGGRKRPAVDDLRLAVRGLPAHVARPASGGNWTSAMPRCGRRRGPGTSPTRPCVGSCMRESGPISKTLDPATVISIRADWTEIGERNARGRRDTTESMRPTRKPGEERVGPPGRCVLAGAARSRADLGPRTNRGRRLRGSCRAVVA